MSAVPAAQSRHATFPTEVFSVPTLQAVQVELTLEEVAGRGNDPRDCTAQSWRRLSLTLAKKMNFTTANMFALGD